MKRIVLILCLALLYCTESRAQFQIGAGIGYSQALFSSSNESGSTCFGVIQISPYYKFKSNWGVGGNLGWDFMLGSGSLRYRNAHLFLAGCHYWDVDKFSFRVSAGPSARLRYCMVDGDLLSLITTIKIGAGIEPSVQYSLSSLCKIFFAPVMDAYFYDPLAGYYTQGLNKRFVWAYNLVIGVNFSL